MEERLKNIFVFLLGLFIKKQKIEAKEINIKKIKRILIIRQHDPMGDVLISTPVIKNLGVFCKDAAIDIMVRPDVAELFVANSYIRKIHIFDKKMFLIAPWKIVSFIRSLRKENYDIALILNSSSFSFTSACLAYFSGARIRIGYDAVHFGRGAYSDLFLTTEVVYEKSRKHEVERNLDIIRVLDIPTPHLSHFMVVTEDEKKYAEKLLNQNGKIIGIHIGAGKIKNRWPIESYAKLNDTLAVDYSVERIVLWGTKENDLGNQFFSLVKHKPLTIKNLKLRELAALFSKLILVICNDTGVLHIAAAVNIPTLAIFGPTEPEYWNPIGNNHWAVKAKDNQCKSIEIKEVTAKLEAMIREKVVVLK